MEQMLRSPALKGKRVFRRIMSFAFGVFVFIVLGVLPVHAAVFNPGCTVAEFMAAINDANGNAEADEINLPAGCTITLDSIDNTTDGNNGLPSITTDITINGNGGTIQRNNASANDFRIFHIALNGVLTLNDVTIQNGLDPVSEGAGIYNLGALNINDSTITNNVNNDYGGGGIANMGGTVVIDHTTISNNTTGYGGGGVRTYGTMTITNSTVSGNTSDFGGGGIRFSSGTMTITDTTISGNASGIYFMDSWYGGGAGINANDGTGVLVLTRCTVTGNISQVGGGGISGNEANGGSITITDSYITNNQAGVSCEQGSGGGISLGYSKASFVLIENTTISGNTSSYGAGGGISHSSSSTTVPLTINNCTISSNSTEASGGGIASRTDGYARLAITNSTFSGNSSGYSGGAILTNSLFEITGCTFSGNTAVGGGGAINFNNSDGSGTVTNCTFAGNTSTGESGGGIRNGGTTEFLNCTFSGNSAAVGGGGVYSDGGTTNIQNTIVAGSLSGGNCSGTIMDDGSNLCDDGTCGFTGDNTDPMLDSGGLQDNGGPTQTIALVAGSPAINGVADCAGLTVDQRGMTRPVGAACDIGAYESQAATSTYLVTYNGNGNTDGAVPVDANSPYVAGATVTVLGNTGSLTRTGNNFNGWNSAADGSGDSYSAGSTFTMPAANVTLYAEWTAVSPAAIPTLSDWGMIIFALLMAGTAVVFMRRRKDMTA